MDSVVGIMLDKSQMGGKTAAAFIAEQSNIWSDASASVVGGSQNLGGGVYRIYSSAGANSYAANTTLLTVGEWYEVRFTIDSVTTLGSGVKVNDIGAAFTTVGECVSILKAETTTAAIKRNGAACDIQISNVQFRRIPGYHALAPSDAARPILRSASSKNYLDADGTDDWMQIFPTLNLGEQWWHVGGWKHDTANEFNFATSDNYRGGIRPSSTTAYRIRDAADTGDAIIVPATIDATAAHVLTVQQTATNSISGRLNGVAGATVAPFDDSASVQGLALFSGQNDIYDGGLDGRFYGGAFGTGTLSSADRALLERYVAGLTGVTI